MTEFDCLLDATIVHLEQFKEDGVSHLPIASTLLDQLKATPQTSRAVSKISLETAKDESRPPKVFVAPTEAIPVQSENSLSEEEKANALTHLKERADACLKCSSLAQSRKNVVFGVGSVNADLMFVGEAPGMDEDTAGEPFVGKAGQLLTRIIETMGLNREVVYIGNVLKCRPDTPGRRYGNRKPTPEEMATCRPYLMEQIRIIRPKVLVALGATAVEGLMGISSVAITRYRGEFKDFGGIPLMPTYHPAYVLRNQSHRIKRQIWEDMLQVMTRLGMPISDKQQGYFSQSSS
jgi:uracil-DNA glycosylase